MNEAEAAWVREHAWTKTMRRTHRHWPAIYGKCPCEYGPCGHCSAGDHANCPYEQANPSEDLQRWAQRQSDTYAGYLTDAQCMGMAELWETGITHDGRCPCARDNHHGALDTTPRQTTIDDFLSPE